MKLTFFELKVEKVSFKKTFSFESSSSTNYEILVTKKKFIHTTARKKYKLQERPGPFTAQ